MSNNTSAAWTAPNDSGTDQEAVEQLFAAIACVAGPDTEVVTGYMALRVMLGFNETDDEHAPYTTFVSGSANAVGSPVLHLEDATFLFRSQDGSPFVRIAVSHGTIVGTWPLAKVEDGEIVPIEEDDDA